MAFIYALADSSCPDEYRYIGKTIRSLDDRLKWHLYRSARGRNKYKNRWIDKVIFSGNTVSIILIEECSNEDQDAREIYWIAKYRQDGFRLTNMTDCGEGGVPNQEVRDKISRALKGRKRPQHVIEAVRARGKLYVGDKNPNFGKAIKPHVKEKLIAANTGRKLTDEHRLKLSTSHKGCNSGISNRGAKLNEDQIVEIYKRIVIDGEKRKSVSDMFGIHEIYTYKITSCKKWKHLNLKERFSTEQIGQ